MNTKTPDAVPPAAESGGRERRRGARLRAAVAVWLTYGLDERKYMEQTVTILLSRFGCSVYTRQEMKPGARVELEHRGRRREARVVYALRNSNTVLLEAGLAFEEDASDFWGQQF